MQDRTGKDGRIGSNPLASLIKWTGFYQEPWVRALDGGEFKASNGQEMVAIFGFLEFCLTQIVMDNELGALQVRARAPQRARCIVSIGIARLEMLSCLRAAHGTDATKLHSLRQVPSGNMPVSAEPGRHTYKSSMRAQALVSSFQLIK